MTTKELRNRIRSIKNTSKVTKAMELVSASKMRRAQQQALRGRPYSQLINSVLSSIAGKIDKTAHPLLIRENNEKEAILLISTDRGLCGSLNSNLFRQTLGIGEGVSFVTLGKKGSLFVSKTGSALVADFELLERPTIAHARTITNYLIEGYLKGDFDKVSVLYTEFISTLKQTPILKQILPIIDEEVLTTLSEEAKISDLQEYLFEPNADAVLETILPHYVQMEVYQVLTEAAASEHSARMVAMKNASDNAEELVGDLTLAYNQLRQASITNEILDIATAAAVLS